MKKFLPILFALGCAENIQPPPELSVGLSLTTKLAGAPIAGRDDEIKLDHFAVNIAGVEFHLCDAKEPTSSIFVSTAYAHVSGDSTRLGSPYVEEFVQERAGARVIGEITPPPGYYCRGYLVVSPADDDAMNLTDNDMFELSGFASGQYRNLDVQEWTSFTHVTTRRAVFEFPTDFTLTEGQKSAVTIQFDDVNLVHSLVDPRDAAWLSPAVDTLFSSVTTQ